MAIKRRQQASKHCRRIAKAGEAFAQRPGVAKSIAQLSKIAGAAPPCGQPTQGTGNIRKRAEGSA